MQNLAIFPLFYLPPISYLSELKGQNFNFLLEKHEQFQKRTHRNRATIASPNGSLDLIIPVNKGSVIHTQTKDVKINYDHKWQRLHWLSLQNYYRRSAYFEFYEDGLIQFYEKKFDFLFDYNLELLNWLFQQLKVNVNLDFSKEYDNNIDLSLDFRTTFTKKNIPKTEVKPYFQVFSDRNEFISNLSIIDLLFNQGPQAKLYL